MSPLARNLPHGETERARTQVVWNAKSILTCVGKGFRSFGEGSSGINWFKSVTLTFFFMSLGHKYRSKHLSKCSWMSYW